MNEFAETTKKHRNRYSRLAKIRAQLPFSGVARTERSQQNSQSLSKLHGLLALPRTPQPHSKSPNAQVQNRKETGRHGLLWQAKATLSPDIFRSEFTEATGSFMAVSPTGLIPPEFQAIEQPWTRQAAWLSEQAEENLNPRDKAGRVRKSWASALSKSFCP